MFAWSEKRRLDAKGEKYMSLPPGHNRRATGLVPMPTNLAEQVIPVPASGRLRELIVSMEGNQTTGCLRLDSPKVRSRAAMLILRGRVMGCIYGRKNLGHQLLGEEAHVQMLSDMIVPDAIINAYNLEEELVVASAALFHGDTLTPPAAHPQVKLAWTAKMLLERKLPGVIVMGANENVFLCMIFICAGKIVGVYSFADGWVEPNYEAALKLIDDIPELTIGANILDCQNVSDVMNYTFSLTGLADKADAERFPSFQPEPKDAGVRPGWQMDSMTPVARPQTPSDEQKAKARWAKKATQEPHV